ncbi:MAG: hypothetical protein HW387_1559 [Parachlamydiales bacterium]|nr:hypothetical protein [Parachlamydiales bacterium]
MKRILALTAICMFGPQCLTAEEEVQSLWHYHPLHVGGQIIRMGKADCHNEHPEHQTYLGNLHYRKSNVFLSMLTPINRHNIFIPQIQFNYVTFDWNKNQKFNETHFYYMTFDLVYYATWLERWRWIMRFDYNLQTEHLSHPGQYSLYNGLMWGSYELNSNWHYHVGALGYVGLKGYNIYPIFGLDYTPSKSWFFQAVFPINYSAEYKIGDWTVAAKIRPLKERLRTGSREPQPRSIFSYSSLGSEVNIRYERQLKLVLEGYVGYNLGGSFYIKNAHGKHAQYVDVNGALYWGLNLDYGF